LVERHGGRFEEGDVSSDYTHLITTQRHINTKKGEKLALVSTMSGTNGLLHEQFERLVIKRTATS
jgi:hypothetical protein